MKDTPEAANITKISAFVHGCNVIRRAPTERKYIRFPESQAIASSLTSFSRSEMRFGSDVSIFTRRECIGTMFRYVEKMPQMQ